MKIFIGDFNVRVGKESWAKTVVVGHGLHDESNGNGVRLINFPAHQQMKTSGTLPQDNGMHKEQRS
jgi:hypothetical protein